MSALHVFEGSCHCGALGFRFETARPADAWSIRACQCSFCRRHQARTTSDPNGRASFLVHDDRCLQRYRFGLGTADFLVCRRCGIYLGAVLTSARGRFATLNVNALNPAREFPRAVPASYEGENVDERRVRRELRWTPVIGAA
jgi:hypothetical protein